MIYATQSLTTCANEAEAFHTLANELALDGSLGGRILAPSAAKPGWRVQVFHEDMGPDAGYPDGMMRVALTPSLAKLINKQDVYQIEAMAPGGKVRHCRFARSLGGAAVIASFLCDDPEVTVIEYCRIPDLKFHVVVSRPSDSGPWPSLVCG